MKRIFVAGHKGMVGSAICRQLAQSSDEVITASRQELDLLDQRSVEEFFKEGCFDEVYLAAAKVGGIKANNTFPADFIYQNLMIQNNVISSAHRFGVQKLLFLGSSCIYPKHAAQPIEEKDLLTGYLEPTNEPYAVAKIAGIKLCESYNRQYGTDYRSVMPTNLYGPGDNYDLENSHVIPALLRKFHDAKIENIDTVTLWGTGAAMREFLYVDDMARASVFVMNLPKCQYETATQPMLSHINVGTGIEVTIRQLAETIARVVDYRGEILWDTSMPDGAPRKLMSSSILDSLGFEERRLLLDGLINTYDHYVKNQNVRH
jgi:GDP-L-fucose synthase